MGTVGGKDADVRAGQKLTHSNENEIFPTESLTFNKECCSFQDEDIGERNDFVMVEEASSSPVRVRSSPKNQCATQLHRHPVRATSLGDPD